MKVQFDSRGREICDPNPIEVPVGFKKPPTLREQIQMYVRSERLAAEVAAQGYESFEEAEDFDVDDDPPDPHSEWEHDFEGSDHPRRGEDSSAARAGPAGPGGQPASDSGGSGQGSGIPPGGGKGSTPPGETPPTETGKAGS